MKILKILQLLVMLLVYAIVSSCSIIVNTAHQWYDELPVGTLSGKIIVQWLDMDLFAFIPDAENPLTFTRSNGESIIPGRMITDGGSIPRPLWAFRNYSPWGYAPAFIVHDWLYQLYQCRSQAAYPNDTKIYSVDESAEVMAEIIKTMMAADGIDRTNKSVVFTMYLAVKSPVARNMYETGACAMTTRKWQEPLVIYELHYGTGS